MIKIIFNWKMRKHELPQESEQCFFVTKDKRILAGVWFPALNVFWCCHNANIIEIDAGDVILWNYEKDVIVKTDIDLNYEVKTK